LSVAACNWNKMLLFTCRRHVEDSRFCAWPYIFGCRNEYTRSCFKCNCNEPR